MSLRGVNSACAPAVCVGDERVEGSTFLDHRPPGVGIWTGGFRAVAKSPNGGHPETTVGYVPAFSRFIN